MKLSNILLIFALLFSAICFVSSSIWFSESNIIVLILSMVGILLGLRLFFPFFTNFKSADPARRERRSLKESCWDASLSV